MTKEELIDKLYQSQVPYDDEDHIADYKKVKKIFQQYKPYKNIPYQIRDRFVDHEYIHQLWEEADWRISCVEPLLRSIRNQRAELFWKNRCGVLTNVDGLAVNSFINDLINWLNGGEKHGEEEDD